VQPNIPKEPFDESIHGSDLFRLQEARSCSLKQFLLHIKTLSVSGACRILKLNIDDKGLLGPLLDPNKEDDCILLNYSEVMEAQPDINPSPRYMQHLSSIHQLVAMPSVIRAHDPKVAFLFECVGYRRHLRPGIRFIRNNNMRCTDLLFHCVIVETIGKVSYLMELSNWLNLCCGDTSMKMRLPTVEESQIFIDFFHQSMTTEGGYPKKKMSGCMDSTSRMQAYRNPPISKTL
jgi:hypothetical protein